MQSVEPCPWCGETGKCTPMCRSKYPDGIEPHDCIDHLLRQQHEWIEPHGEPCFQEWWVCSWCDETFTEREVDELIAKAV